MTLLMTAARRLGIVCDLSIASGTGHLMRSAALAEEFIRNGWTVSFVCDTSVIPMAAERIRSLGAVSKVLGTDPSEYVRWCQNERFDAVLIDSYRADPAISQALTREVATLAFIDGPTRGQSAHLYIDQNYGAQDVPWPQPGTACPDAIRLAGVKYAVIRDDVVALRSPSGPNEIGTPMSAAASPALHLVVVMGGTDPRALMSPIVDQLANSRVPIEVSVVTAAISQNELDALTANARNPLSSFRAVMPTPNFASLLSGSDAVITAMGSTTWELCCLGKPIAGVAVAENQQPTYRGLVNAGIIAGLGDVSHYSPTRIGAGNILDSAELGTFLSEGARRARLARSSYGLVDGLGKRRIYETFTSRIAPSR
jgi:spore coat polysaccharide biosynthesis predicted glycosyltransferase SpsG